MRHFLYKSKSLAQFTSPALMPPYSCSPQLEERFAYLFQVIDWSLCPPLSHPWLPCWTLYCIDMTCLTSRLFRHYQLVHHRMHLQSRALKVYFHAIADEVILGWVGFPSCAVENHYECLSSPLLELWSAPRRSRRAHLCTTDCQCTAGFELYAVFGPLVSKEVSCPICLSPFGFATVSNCFCRAD